MTELNIKSNISLASYTTIRIGGPAKWLIEATRTADIIPAYQWAQAQKIPVAVLGGGSNTIVADHGFNGLVIITRNDETIWQPPEVTAEAGVKLGHLIAGALAHKLGGLSWLVGVPGTVGGAVAGNSGSREAGLGDYVTWVDVLDQTGSRRLTHKQCNFSYRSSIFHNQPGCILGVRLKLPEVDQVIEQQKIAAAAAKKNSTQPMTDQSAGCMFINPTVEPNRLPVELRQYVFPDQTIASWRLITAVGLAGFRLGQLAISTKHANFLTNLGGGTADQVMQIISLVKQRVRDTYGVQLHEEVRYLGF